MLPRSRNRLDLIRLLAALTVLLIHSIPIYGLKNHLFPQIGLAGEMAVMVFFTISGYLITGSYLASRSLKPFLLNRSLRIFPGLIGVTLCSIALGAALTSLPLHTYLHDPATWHYLQNILLYPQVGTLPGVFETNPIPLALNGSLWTLRIEFTMYLLIPVLAFLRLLTPERILWIVAAFWIAFNHVLNLPYPPLVFYMESLAIAKFGISFMLGSALYLWRDRITLRADIAWLCLILLTGSFKTPSVGFATLLLIPYPTLYFGLQPSRWRFPDISYGVYIFAFPLQQTYMQLIGRSLPPVWFPLTVIPCVGICALLSWYGIEKPMLRLKRQSTRKIVD